MIYPEIDKTVDQLVAQKLSECGPLPGVTLQDRCKIVYLQLYFFFKQPFNVTRWLSDGASFSDAWASRHFYVKARK